MSRRVDLSFDGPVARLTLKRADKLNALDRAMIDALADAARAIDARAEARVAILAGEGKVKKLVEAVEQVSFSGPRAVAQGQEVLYVTERCVMRLERKGVTVVELAPGVDLRRDVLDRAGFPLEVAEPLATIDGRLFHPEPFGLALRSAEEAGR